MRESSIDSLLLMYPGSLDELVKHGLRALRDTLPQEVDLTSKVSMNFWLDVGYLEDS